MKQIQINGQDDGKSGKMPKPQQSTEIMKEDKFIQQTAQAVGNYVRIASGQNPVPQTTRMPWELGRSSRGFWNFEKNRTEATKWLLKKTGKKPEEIIVKDFMDNGLGGLIESEYLNCSPYLALKEAGVLPDDFEVWQMKKTPNGTWDSKKICIRAVKWLLKITNKKPEELTQKDFNDNYLSGLLQLKYNNAPHLALKEAGVLPEGFMSWHMNSHVPNNYWDSKDNRIEAVKWILKETGKKPEEISQKDFNDNHLGGLLASKYKCSPYLALKEAGVLPDDFEVWQMKITPMGTFDSEENRIKATKWLLKKTGKNPEEISTKDFYNNRLYGLLKHYKMSPYLALKEADVFPNGFKPWQMKDGAPSGYWKYSKENRIDGTKWLLETTGKKPEEIKQKDFLDNGLNGLLHYHNGSPSAALKEAGVLIEGFMPWQTRSHVPNNFWGSIDNRIAAVKWLVEKTGKKPDKIDTIDFKDNGLCGLLQRYNGSAYAALKEAGLIKDGFEMKNAPKKGITNKSFNQRVAEAMRKYVDKRGISNETNPK